MLDLGFKDKCLWSIVIDFDFFVQQTFFIYGCKQNGRVEHTQLILLMYEHVVLTYTLYMYC